MNEQLGGWANRAFTPVFDGLRAVARSFDAAKAIVRRAHASHDNPHHARTRGHGEREAVPDGKAVPSPLPTLQAPSAQPRSETSDVGQARGAGPEQAHVRMGWGEGIPPSRDRD